MLECWNAGMSLGAPVFLIIPAFRHSGIPAFQHSSIPAFQHSGIPAFRHLAFPPSPTLIAV
jgi:hypothetical protein